MIGRSAYTNGKIEQYESDREHPASRIMKGAVHRSLALWQQILISTATAAAVLLFIHFIGLNRIISHFRPAPAVTVATHSTEKIAAPVDFQLLTQQAFPIVVREGAKEHEILTPPHEPAPAPPHPRTVRRRAPEPQPPATLLQQLGLAR